MQDQSPEFSVQMPFVEHFTICMLLEPNFFCLISDFINLTS